MSNYTVINSEKDQYPHFSDTIQERFAMFADKPLFTTNAEGLFDAFLNGLPVEARQHYTCNCCRHFIDRFGGLVAMPTDDGVFTSVLWNDEETPEFFKKSVKAMKRIVLKSRVTGIFLSSERTLGTPSSNGWSHMNVQLPASRVHRDRLKTAGQAMAEKKEDFRILIAGLVEYPVSAVEKAVALLESESLYRSDRVLGVAKFVQELHQNRQSAKESRERENITWLAVATAPSGFTHIKSSMIGTLLDDIVAGYPTDSIARRFAEKMNPANYMRSQSAPSQGNIEQAEKIVEKLGITSSLVRRYAQISEVPLLWQNKEIDKRNEKKSGGVFGNLATKESRGMSPATPMEMQNTVMTWEKFQRTVLPTAKNLEVMVDNPSRFMALVTAYDDKAPNILQWDNTFSWYYHGGIDGEIKRRVESAGGQYENNEIRCSLIWEGYTDLDLHCVTPNGHHIHYANKRGDNGWLDIDMNAGGHRDNSPVENIRWNQGEAKSGKYQFYVHNFTERGKGNTPFKVELEVNGKVYTTHGTLYDSQKHVAFGFNYIKGQDPIMTVPSTYTTEDTWSVSRNSFVKVNGITNSPNQWGENKAEHVGHHIFFLLDGVQDSSEGKGRGFFTETLKPELREIRKTLEAYTANTPIEGVDEATACGVGYSKDSEWNLVVKVTTDNSTRLIKIDRWD